MPEKTIPKEDNRHHGKKEPADSVAEDCKPDEKGIWSEDQQKKSYYYDDAYGYEIYNPDKDDETENC